MDLLIIYTIKANILIMLVVAMYYLWLRNLTYYSLNRIFFTIGLISALIVPGVNFTPIIAQNHQLLHEVNLIAINWDQLQLAHAEHYYSFDYKALLPKLYLVISMIFALRFAIQLLSIASIHKASKLICFKGINFRAVDFKLGPFSFVNQIYCNPESYTDEQLETILKHEQIHVEQCHFLDVLLTEICVVFFWFNPLVWLARRFIKENLEFITDRTVLEKGVYYKTYQYNLLNISTASAQLDIVQSFNDLTIKKRIKVMNRAKSSRAKIGRYLIVFTTLIIFSAFVNVSQAQLNNINSTLLYQVDTTKLVQPGAEKHYKELGLNVTANLDHPKIAAPRLTNSSLTTQSSLYKKEEELFDFSPREDSADEHSLVIGHAANRIAYFIDGVRAANYDQVKKEDVYKIQVLAGSDAKKIFNDIDAEQVIIITTKANINSKAVQELNRKLAGIIKPM